MEPIQYMNVMQMIGFTLGRIESFSLSCKPEEHCSFKEIAEQVLEISNYIKHCAECNCVEMEGFPEEI